jgi:hypothetical protein
LPESLFAERILGIPWSVVALAAFGVAVVFVLIDTSAGTIGLRWIAMRWLHSVCWLLLGFAALAMARFTPIPQQWAVGLAAAGGAAYLGFLAATLTR